jgi:CelD/BcsL family acetyltransferase involved in cellulose biosynthesis
VLGEAIDMEESARMPSETALRFEWITDADHFLQLRDEWNSLGSSAIETVFLTHAWLASWLLELAPEAQLHVLTAWDGDRLVAALPLFGDPKQGRGRRWAFMGVGTLTPNHLDVIAKPSYLPQARARFAEMLVEKRAEWDVVEFGKLPADTPTAEELTVRFAGAGFATTESVAAACPYCELPASYEEYVATLKRRLRKKIRQTRRWVADEPDSRRLAVTSTESDSLAALASLIRIHQARWEGKGYPGAFADPRVVRFHERVVREAGAAGCLRMFVLSDGDDTIAVSYDFHVGSTVQAYLSSFDERWAEASPGVLLRSYVIEHSISEGANRFDFLEGEEDYKAAWCPSRRQNLRLAVFNRTLAGRMSHARLIAGEATIRFARRAVPQSLRDRVLRFLAHRRATQDTESADS